MKTIEKGLGRRFLCCKKMTKAVISTGMLVGMLFSLTACTNLSAQNVVKEKVKLSIWASEQKKPLIENIMQDFCNMNKDKVKIEYTISEEDESTCKETILSNPDGAADIFSFADDQLDELVDASVLHSFSEVSATEMVGKVGGDATSAIQAVTRDDKIYAYPETAGNGYFLYYNKKYLSEDDVKDLDTILEKVAKYNKKFAMDFTSGWYLYSFFKGAGLVVNQNATKDANVCDWNATGRECNGVDVANKLLDISKDKGFVSADDKGFLKGLEDGSIVVAVNGAWNAKKVEDAWGDDYAATKLPQFKVNGKKLQMCSFTGYKVLGINAKTKYPEWCEKIVNYITSEQNQIKEFETTGELPANKNAVESDKVKASPAIDALGQQESYSYIQRVRSPFWDAAKKFGIIISSGNGDKRDVQGLLDDMVRDATKKEKAE